MPAPAVVAVLVAAGPCASARDLTLDQALAVAREHSPSLAMARARLDQAQADVLTAQSALLPKVSGGAWYNRLAPDRLGPNGMEPPAGASSLFASEAFAGVRAKQVVFDGLRGWALRRSAQSGVEAEQAGLEAAGADLDYAVVQTFVHLLEAQQLVDVARQALERQRAFEQLADGRAREGRGFRLDLLRATAQRLDAERGVSASEGTRAATEAQLRRLLGTPDPASLRAAGPLPDAVSPAPAEDGVVEAALRSNPDHRRLELMVRQAQAAASAAAGSRYPELSLQGAAGYRVHDVGGSAPEWNAGVFLEWSLFDGGATVGQVRKADARVRELREAVRALALQLRADVREALAAWEVASSAVRSATAAAEASREADAQATALFEQGRATALDALTARADVTRAEAARVRALSDVRLARARVERIAGDATGAGKAGGLAVRRERRGGAEGVRR